MTSSLLVWTGFVSGTSEKWILPHTTHVRLVYSPPRRRRYRNGEQKYGHFFPLPVLMLLLLPLSPPPPQRCYRHFFFRQQCQVLLRDNALHRLMEDGRGGGQDGAVLEKDEKKHKNYQNRIVSPMCGGGFLHFDSVRYPVSRFVRIVHFTDESLSVHEPAYDITYELPLLRCVYFVSFSGQFSDYLNSSHVC